MIVEDTFIARGRGKCAVVRLDRVPELGDSVVNARTGDRLRILDIERNARELVVGSVTSLCFDGSDIDPDDVLEWVDV